MKPLVSIVIPVYNEEKRIGRALNSMCRQTHQNLEIIVVDDHSTDGTADTVRAIAATDPRVSYYLYPKPAARRTNWRGYDINAGYAARNYGFRIARGEWITTQDADDASLRNRIEAQLSLAERYSAALVTIQWQQLTPERLGKKLDIDRVFAEKGEKGVVIRPEEIVALAARNRGILMREPFHRFIPFPLKWFPYTRKLFYRRMDPYPGADNSMLFHRSVRDAGFYFRSRNARTWGKPDGRASGRDFAFRVAVSFNNSWSFRLPMYLWDVRIQNPEYGNYQTYLL